MAFVFEDQAPQESRFVFEDAPAPEEPSLADRAGGALKDFGTRTLGNTRVIGATAGGFLAYPVSGIAGLSRLITTGSLDEANKTIEGIQSVPGKLIQTPEEQKGMEAVGMLTKPFEMAGEGGRLIGKATGIPYAEPVLGTVAETSAMFGLPGAVKAAKGRLSTAPKIPEAGAVTAHSAKLDAISRIEDRILNPEGAGKPALPPGQGFELKGQPYKERYVFEDKPALPSGEVRPTLPFPEGMGEGFTFKDAPEGILRKAAPDVQGAIEPLDVQVEYKPFTSRAGTPYKTEATAERAALKAGMKADSFEVVPVEGGFGVRKAGYTINPTERVNQYFDQLKVDITADAALSEPEKALVQGAIEADRKAHLDKVSESATIPSVVKEPGTANIPPETAPKAVGGNPFKKSTVQEKVFHGGESSVESFDRGPMRGEGVGVAYFTNDREVAKAYAETGQPPGVANKFRDGHVGEYYINIEKPLTDETTYREFFKGDEKRAFEFVNDFLAEYDKLLLDDLLKNGNTEGFWDSIETAEIPYIPVTDTYVSFGDNHLLRNIAAAMTYNETFRREVYSRYDGIIYTDAENGGTSYIPFSEKSIKKESLPNPSRPPEAGGQSVKLKGTTTLTSGIDPTRTLEVLRSLKENVKQAAGKSDALRGIKQEILSPETILSKDPAGRKIYEAADFYDQEKNKFLSNEATEFEKVSKGVREGSPESVRIGQALDGKLPPSSLTAQEKGVYTFFKTKYDFLIKEAAKKAAGNEENYRQALNLANRREKPTVKVSELTTGEQNHYKGLKTITDRWDYLHEKWKERIDPGLAASYDLLSRKLSDYLPHIFDKEVLVDEFKQEAARLTDQLRTATNPTAVKGYKERLAQLETAIRGIEGGKVLTYRQLPKNIRFRFFETRLGKEGYSFDAIKAYKTYLNGIARKMFDEPAAKIMAGEAQNIGADLKPYSEWYIRRFMGLNRHPLDNLAANVASFQWMRTLGLNPRSALVNLTQRLNTVATVGEKYSWRGEKFGFTKEGKALFDNTGIAKEVPGVLMEGDVAPRLEKVRAVLGYMFNKVELGNRKHAFLSGYLKAKDMGMSEAAAIKYGEKIVHDTQFRYGRVGMSKGLSSPIGRVAFQFSSYPIKQAEFLVKLAKENPAKLIKWLAYAEGGNIALQKWLDTDMSNAMGVGITWGEAIKAVADLSKGDTREAFRHVRLMFNPGGGILPSGLGPTATGIGKVASAIPEGKGMATLKKELTPVVYGRLKQAYLGVKNERGGQYPIMNAEGHVSSKVSGAELLQRTIGPKTATELEASRSLRDRASLIKERNAMTQEIVGAIVDKDYAKARELIAKYKVVPTKLQIENEMKRRQFTQDERNRMRKPGKNEAFMYQREGRIY